MRIGVGQGRALGWAVMAAAGVQVLLFGWFLARTTIHLPFLDMLDWIDSYLAYRSGGDLPGYLWAFHNEHHLVWIRLLTAVDVAAFHADGTAFIATATASLVGAATLVAMALRRGLPPSPPLRPLIWLAPMLMLTTVAVVDCSIPINSVYPITLLCLIASLVLFDGAGATRSGTFLRRAAALGFGVGAAFGNGVGLVIWPILLWLGWRSRAGAGWLAATAVVGAGFTALYLHAMPEGTPLQAEMAGELLAPGHLHKMADYLLAYLGLPLSRSPGLAVPSRVFGAALLVAGSACCVWVGLVSRRAGRLERFAVGLILVTFGSALLAVLGRTDLEAEVKIPVRYAVMVAPLHVGLFILALSWIAQRAQSLRWRTATLATGVVFALVMLAQQVAAGRAAVAVTDAMRARIAALYAGDRTAEVVAAVYPDPARAVLLAERLRAAGLVP